LSIVLDASMVLAWLFTEEHTRAAQEIMRNIALDGAIVPSLWHRSPTHFISQCAENVVMKIMSIVHLSG